MTDGDRAATAALLKAAHPGAIRFSDTAWLDWLYDRNPVGTAFERSRDVDGERIGHVACVPQRWRRGDRRATFLCTVNAVTAPGSGRSVFAGLVARALRDAADTTIVGYGVTNDASSLPALNRLRAHLVGSLPVVLALPAPPGDVRSLAGDESGLSGPTLTDLVADLPDRSPKAWCQEWTADTLRWRLSAPGTRYAVHWTDEVLAVSARTRVRGMPVGVLMKLIVRRDRVASATVRRVVGAVHRHHRVAVVVYAGFNHLAPVSGIRLPTWIRPGPLNLFVVGDDIGTAILKDPGRAGQGIATSDMEFEAFELLDFDAV